MQLPHQDVEELTVAELLVDLASGARTSTQMVRAYLARMDAIDGGLDLRSVIVRNPDAERIAAARDRERLDGRLRGPLHGVPILLKDNIDTVGAMGTTAGSLALVDSAPAEDATVTDRLTAAGAIVIGKTNLSEWANFRSRGSSSGWSAVGGACRNPYVLDRNPSGSSSGSGAAVAANLAMVAIGTETDGSIICPSTVNGIVGIKPTVGLTSRAGVVPISHTQDTIGPMARTVADAAAILGPMTGVDSRDPATEASAGNHHTDYTAFLDHDGLRGARIGVARQLCDEVGAPTAAILERIVSRLPELGATVVDPVDFPSFEEFQSSTAELDVLRCEFKTDLGRYLATRIGGPKSLAEVIAFNEENRDRELRWFGQEQLVASEATGGVDDPEYKAAHRAARRISRDEGLDAVLDTHRLDAIIAPSGGPAEPTDLASGERFRGGSSSYAAMAGYPLITVPMGSVAGLPVGLTFMGRAWAEPTLIAVACGFEHHLGGRIVPTFQPTLDRDNPSA
ncbi:MAG: amidase [Actinomycetota bacterium]